jgi:AraC family transcriptional regulator
MLADMTCTDELSVNPADRFGKRIVRHEKKWFIRPEDEDGGSSVARLAAFRWAGFSSEARDEVSTVETDCPVLGIALRPMDITLFAGKKLIHDGLMRQGMMRVNEPGQPLRGIYRGGFDILHLYIPNAVIADCVEGGYGQFKNSAMSLAPSNPTLDPVIERLGQALVRADDFDGTFGQCYADSVGLAIVARLLSRGAHGAAATPGARVSTLPRWRLKRATDYMTAHLGESIGLTEIAASTGLTRMHFAAQFRATTGLRPHEYLVRRRVERAQTLLATSCLPLVEVALEVGFKSQAHFTTVFNRVVGATPHVWRNENHGNSTLPTQNSLM